jgi:hypothetical protein
MVMKNCNAPKSRTARRIPLLGCAAALALTLTASLPQPAHAGQIVPPTVPGNLQVPAGHKAFREGFAAGTQNYICMPTATGYGWSFLGPQATLFNEDDEQSITHYLSPNPVENGTARATWQHSRDTSSVWAVAIASSTDPAFVAQGAIPWLLLQVVGAQDGPTGGDKLSPTAYIQRVHTSGGVAPSSGCSSAADVGKRALVPYTTDYLFYKSVDDGSDD